MYAFLSLGVALFVLLLAWVIGRLHISRVPPGEVGKLGRQKLAQRVAVYVAPLALVTVAGTFRDITARLASGERTALIALTSLAAYFFILIATLSYLEVFWYRSRPKGGRRHVFFRDVCLPVLYSSLYLYWITIAPAWLLFLAAAIRS